MEAQSSGRLKYHAEMLDLLERKRDQAGNKFIGLSVEKMIIERELGYLAEDLDALSVQPLSERHGCVRCDARVPAGVQYCCRCDDSNYAEQLAAKKECTRAFVRFLLGFAGVTAVVMFAIWMRG